MPPFGLLLSDAGSTVMFIEDAKRLLSDAMSDITMAQSKVGAALLKLDEQTPTPDPDPQPDPGPQPKPDPDPDPPSDEVYPLTVNGKQWTFRTPAPANLKVKAEHPRFLLPGREDELRHRLESDTYKKWRQNAENIQPRAMDAMRYALLGDTAAGTRAKNFLLSREAKGQLDENVEVFMFHEILLYDWCYDLFTPEERERAMYILGKRIWINLPAPGEIDFNQNHPGARLNIDGGFRGQYGNNSYEPGHLHGVLYRGLLALAFHGDGVRDEWCEHGFQTLMTNTDGRFIPMYDPLRGGLIDLHNQRALDSGGTQSGWHHQKIMDGYESNFGWVLPNFMEAWNTATGDDTWTDNNYFRLMPYHIAYRWRRGQLLGPGEMTQIVSMLTGIYKDRDPEMAGVAKYLASQTDEGRYRDFLLFILGDRSTKAIHPKDLPHRFPLAKTLNGADLCVSRSDWGPDATVVQLTTRTLDTHRYEPSVGILDIARKGTRLLARGHGRKGAMRTFGHAAIQIWETGRRPQEFQQSETTWTIPDSNRVQFPYHAVTQDLYRGIEPSEDHGDETYHVFAVDSAKFRINGTPHTEFYKIDVDKCKRTIVHLRPNGGREFIVVYDRVEVGPGLSHCWGTRTENEPTVAGNAFTAVNGNQQIVGTVLTPGMIVEKRGGIPKCTEGPNGELYGGVDSALFDDGREMSRWFWGYYSVFIKPNTIRQQQDYCVVLEVGDEGFTPAPAMMNGTAVSVDGWSVDFSSEDQTKVSR